MEFLGGGGVSGLLTGFLDWLLQFSSASFWSSSNYMCLPTPETHKTRKLKKTMGDYVELVDYLYSKLMSSS